MKFPVFKHPSTGKPDSILTLTCFVVIACTLKFVLEGVAVHLFGGSFTLGHADAATYMAVLTPVMGAHGFREYNSFKPQSYAEPCKVDDPDA